MTRRTVVLTAAQLESLTRAAEPYLSCEDCFDLVDSWVEAVLAGRPDEVAPGLAAHLASCAACAEEAESLLELVQEQGPTPGRAGGRR